jgi:hypothetical protein
MYLKWIEKWGRFFSGRWFFNSSIYWDEVQFSMVQGNNNFEDRGSTFLQNICELKLEYTEYYPRRLRSS